MTWFNERGPGIFAQAICKRWFGVAFFGARGPANSTALNKSQCRDVDHEEKVTTGSMESDLTRLAALGMMTTGIVHDFRNLLQVVDSAVRIIDRELDRRGVVELKPILSQAIASVDRAAGLSRKILGFSRSERVLDAFDLNLALASLQAPISWVAGDTVQVEMSLGKGMSAIFCDIEEFEAAVLNIVVNAKDAMLDGGNLRIETFREDRSIETQAAHGVVALCITDTGCGMPPEVIKAALRARYTTKPVGKGNGLGLTTVREFMQRSGGSVQIQSAVGLGTSITLRFPTCRD